MEEKISMPNVANKQVVSNENKDGVNSGPVKKLRSGAICATIWANMYADENGVEKTVHSITLSRSYKDKNDEWKETNSFRVMDLPKVRMLTEKAFEFLSLTEVDLEKKE